MKQLFRFWIVAALLLVVGCSKEYDDSALVGRVDDLESRVQRLEQLCQQMNTNISSLQTIVTALHNNDYVTGVTPITENGKTIGYTITFAKAESITIYHGKDGQDGADGKDGQDGADGKDGQDGTDGKDGQDGTDGKDGYTPVIGVKQDTDGIYYWTLDGDWLLDDNGNKIKAQGTDGQDGQDGTNGTDGKDGEDGQDGQDGTNGTDGKDGEDGITPQLKIEDDYWYVSYDNGASWTQLGKATGEDGKDGANGTNGTNGADGKDGDSFFQSVTQDESNVYFTLADGTVITVPKGLALSIEFDESDLVVMSPNSTREIGYTVTSATETVKVEVTSSVDIKAKVVADDGNGLTGKIHITTGDAIDEYSKVIVFVSNGDKVIMRSITFEEAGLVVEENTTKQAASEGGEMTLEFLSNVECEVIIPNEAQSWISVVPATRAMEKQTITLKLEPNESYYRSATVTVQSSDGTLKLEYQVEQDGELGVEIDPTQIPDNEIWYRTSTGRKLSTNADICNANLVSNTYSYGVGVLRFENTILTINSEAFTDNTLIELYVPDCVERLSAAFLRNSRLKSFRVPKELKYAQGKNECGPFENNTELTILTGHHVSEDGKCLVIGTELADFVGIDLTEYTTPHDVTIIREYAFSENNTLEKIIISEGVQIIEDHAFLCNTVSNRLKEVSLPKSIKQIGAHVFLGCNKIELFSGECDLVSNDGYSIIIDNYYQGLKGLIKYASGSSITSYNIPDGVGFLETNAFDSANNLTHIYFPSSVVLFNGQPFENSYNIQTLSGSNILIDNKSLVVDNVLLYVAPKGLNQYRTPQGVTYIGYGALADKPELEEVVISDEVIAVGSLASCRPYEIPLGYILWDNPNLKTVTISANMRILGMDPFGPGANGGLDDSKNIETVYLRAPIPPVIGHNFSDKIPTSFPNLTIYVPEASLEAYMSSPDWAPYRGYFKGYNYTDLPEDDTYISSDYSKDGVATTLQTATKGDGIDIVLMGDAYSDRQIADGTYKADMENLYDNLFTEEPYKSFKDHFNVYYVNVVSATEGYEYGNTALDGYFGDGTLVGGNDNAVFNYALNAISEHDMDEALLIVAMNSDNYAGTCYMYYPTYTTGTYGSGLSVAYFPRGGDATTFAQLLHHEACGHGFAKLADEYAYEDMGTAPSDYVSEIKSQQTNWGWWKNVDFTSDPTATRWSHFVNDTRYANDGLGAYEGGLTYWTGVWRPTENSIMRYNTGGFNAPSREAIYYRIHKLAYGDSWEYDYEDFVEWDARNRTTAATRAMVYKPANYKPTHPPVIVNKPWRDAK